MTALVPGSYWLNLIALNAMACGSAPGEVMRAAGPAAAALAGGASDQDPALREAWFEAWCDTARELATRGDAAVAAGQRLSAAASYRRACAAWLSAEWSLRLSDPRKVGTFDALRDCFRRLLPLDDAAGVALRIPFAGRELDACLFEAGDAGAPVVVHLNGTHSCMEWPVLSGTVEALRQRGIASLVLDHPGSGSARYHAGLGMNARSEEFGAAVLDVLDARQSAPGRRVGLLGVSMGGYHAARIGALDPRVSAVACWGALYRIPAWQIPGEAGAGDFPDLAAESEALTLYGAGSREALAVAMRAFTLEGVLGGLRCPLLVAHGALDAQVPVEQVELVTQGATSAARVDRLVFDRPGFGAMHASLDNLPLAREAIADWLAGALRG